MVGSGSVKVFSAEATGPMRSKMHPRLSTMAKWIWTIYLGLTIACVLSFYACGMSWFDSINYAMTTTATGGFATHNDTTTYFNSPAIEYVSVLYQFLAGINFAMLYMAIFKFKVGNLFRSSEFKLYIFIIVSATVFIAYLLITRNGYGLERAFRSSLFHVVSFMTTTGIFNDDAAMWPRITWIVLGCLMFIGACSGSTTGGFKCIRLVMVFKVLRNEFRRILHPNAILPVKVNGQTVSQQKLSTLLAFFAIFTFMVLITATLMVMAGIDYTNSTVISLSCISNVGASLSTEIGPVLTWGELPIHIKWTCSFLMLVGRLEIMSVLVLFTRAFWKDN
jgi:trk system potassium uptake protein TrkH